MQKYYFIAKNTWDEILSYRANFILWRVRAFLGMLTGYFLWTSIMPEEGTLFGYSKQIMVTYVLAAPIVFSIVFSTRTHEISENINTGGLSFFLTKPVGYFKYWFARDIGDKLMNISFSLSEFLLFLLIVRPDIFLQTNLFYLVIFFVSLFLAIILMFFIGCLMSMVGFWSPEVWAPRFIFYTLVSFLAGSLFPLDILPGSIYEILRFLPFAYLQYFPIKIYLGQVSTNDLILGFGITLAWIGISYLSLTAAWNKGIRNFTASGG